MVKYLRNLFLTIVLATTLTANNLATLDNAQRVVLTQSHYYGERMDFGYTLMAIAWQESKAGKYKINLQDPSCGTYHNLITSVMARHKDTRDTGYNRNRMCQMLINNSAFAASEALAELEYWWTKYEGKPSQWSKTIMSYNAGHNYENGSNYLELIRSHVKHFQTHKNWAHLK